MMNGVELQFDKIQDSTTESALECAVSVLKANNVIAVPTDTVYGFAAFAQSVKAVSKICRVKGRSTQNPIAICVSDILDIYKWCKVTVPKELLQELLPGPVTVVFERNDNLNFQLNPGTLSVGVRILDTPFIQALVSRCQQPLALTSANLSGQPNALAIQDFEVLWPELGLVVNGGQLGSKDGRQFLGSTVVVLSEPGIFRFKRPGCAEAETRETLKKFGLTELQYDHEAK